MYCDEADLYSYGLPRGALTNPGRLVASVSTSNGQVTLNVHGFVPNDPVTFRAESGGSLPSPLAEGVTYYAQPVDQARFRLSATEGGPAITLTTAGARVLVIAPLPIESAIRWASAIVDDMLPAHLVPLEDPVPEIVRGTTAELAAGKLLTRTGAASESLTTTIDAAGKRLARWAKGVPLRGANIPAERANTAVSSARAPHADRRGWRKYGGIC